MIFSPQYIPYKKRIFNSLIRVVLISFLLFSIFILIDINRATILITGIIWLIAIIPLFINVYNRSQEYLNSISIDDEYIELECFEKDKLVFTHKIKTEKIKIIITQLFFSFTKYGKNFKLEIKELQDGKYITLAEQYEIGNWDLDLFKEVYKDFCLKKGLPLNLETYKRTNF